MRSSVVVLVSLLAGSLSADASPGPMKLRFEAIGPEGGDVRSLGKDPQDSHRLYAGTADGILYASSDGGALWERLDPGFPVRAASIDDIVVAEDGSVFVGFWRLDGTGGGIYVSRDRGTSFERVAKGLEREAVRGFARAPSNPNVVVAVTRTGVFRSTDSGESFARVSPVNHPAIQIVGSVAIDPRNPDEFYVGTARLAWATSDAGRTWRSIDRGMINDSDVMTLNVDRRSSSTLYATACTGIWRSRDRGGMWSKVLGIPQVSRRTRAFAQDPDRSEVFYAGTTDGIYVSDTDAATFSRTTVSGLIVNAIVPLGGGRVVAGVEGDGIITSADYGRTWAVSNRGFRERQIRMLATDATSGRIYAVTGAEGARASALLALDENKGQWNRVALPEGREVTALGSLSWGEIALGTDEGLFFRSSALDGSSVYRKAALLIRGVDQRPRVEAIYESDEGLYVATSLGLFKSYDHGAKWNHETLGLSRAVVALGPGPSGNAVAATPLQVFDVGPTTRDLSSTPDRGVKALGFLPRDPDVVFLGSSRGLLRSRDGGRTWISPEAYPLRRVTGLAFHPEGHTIFAADADIQTVYVSTNRGDSFWPIEASGLPSQRVFAMSVAKAKDGAMRLLLAASGGGLLSARLPESTKKTADPLPNAIQR